METEAQILSRNRRLSAEIGKALKEKKLKLATAESCTGGLIGSILTDIPGSSDYYLGGIISYDNLVKNKILGVPADILDNYGAVSAETVTEMARGIRALYSSFFDKQKIIGLSTSGIAGPGGGTPEKPVGTTWVGLSTSQGDLACLFRWKTDRLINKQKTVAAALNILWKYLDELDSP